MARKYFDTTRDKAQPFFCEACLTGLPEDKRSSEDPRFCQNCKTFMDNLSSNTPQTTQNSPKACAITPSGGIPSGSQEEEGYGTEENAVGGRPRKEAPVKLIKELAAQGMTGRAIYRRLCGELEVSLRTIHRVLNRPQLELPLEGD